MINEYVVPILCLFLLFIIAIFPLCAKSQLWIDEVLESDPAYNLAFRHKMTESVWEGIYRTEECFFMRPPVHFIVLSFFYKLFGFSRSITLSVSLVFATFSFCVVYLIAMIFTKDVLASFLSASLMGFSNLGVSIAKSGRTDSTALFFFTISLLIFFTAQNRNEAGLRKIFTVLSAVFLSLAGQTYQLYICLFLSFIFYYFFEMRFQRKEWFKEMVLFTVAYGATFIIWISFILRDFQAFRDQFFYHFYQTLNWPKVYSLKFFMQRLKETIFTLFYFSPFSSLFFILGSVFFVRKLPQYKKTFLGFVLLPVLILSLFHMLKGNYIEIVLPLGFVGIGFFTAHCLRLLKKKLAQKNKKDIVLLECFLGIFFLSHFIFGIGAKYYSVIKDWKIRNLAAYEKELINLIPPGSRVLGGPENWYALTKSGSRLFVLECLYQPTFNWNKIDYIIIPIYLYEDLKKINFSFFKFINDCCKEIAKIGIGGYSYSLQRGSKIFSGYLSIVYKVNKE